MGGMEEGKEIIIIKIIRLAHEGYYQDISVCFVVSAFFGMNVKH